MWDEWQFSPLQWAERGDQVVPGDVGNNVAADDVIQSVQDTRSSKSKVLMPDFENYSLFIK